MNIQIKPIRPEMYDVCAEMIASNDPWLTLKITAPMIKNFISRDFIEVYGAILNDDLIGVGCLNRMGLASQPYIPILFVKAGCRSKGIGKKLIEFFEKEVFACEKNLFLTVSSFNKKALRFYKKLGFFEVGELKDYIIKGSSEILLRKTIGPKIG